MSLMGRSWCDIGLMSDNRWDRRRPINCKNFFRRKLIQIYWYKKINQLKLTEGNTKSLAKSRQTSGQTTHPSVLISERLFITRSPNVKYEEERK